MAATTKGICYLCGAELGKTAMKNHILKAHITGGDSQACRLLKIEGAYDKDYWLYVDVPATSSLSVLDSFLRKIWLECCGHMSAFEGPGYQEFGMSNKIGSFGIGDKFLHEYDFGSTTETLVTVMADTTRRKQKEAVRLLARNIAPEYRCKKCGAPAEIIDMESIYGEESPFYCAKCADDEGLDDMILPVTNSPRMGVCGYCGEQDVFTYPNPAAQKGGK